MKSAEGMDGAFGPGGAMEFITEARRQGTVRSIGVTGHVTAAAHRRAREYWDQGMRFGAMQMPPDLVGYHQQTFTRHVLPLPLERGIGVIAMTTSADGALLREGPPTMDECQRYAWSLPVSVAVVGMERPELVRQNARRAPECRAMPEAEIAALRSRLEPPCAARAGVVQAVRPSGARGSAASRTRRAFRVATLAPRPSSFRS